MATEQNTSDNFVKSPGEAWVEATIMNSVEAVTHLFTNALTQSINVFKQAVTYENTVFQASMEQAAVIIQNSLQTVVGGFSKTANEIGQDALKARMAEAKANVGAMAKARSAEMALENLRTRAVYSQTQILVDTVAKQSKTNTEFVENMAKLGGGKINQAMDEITSSIEEGGFVLRTLGLAGQAFGTATAMGAKLQNITAQQNAELIKAAMNYNLEMLETNKILYDTAAEQMQSILDKGEKIVDEFTQLYANVRKTVETSDTASRKLAVQMGYYGRQGDIYAKSMMSTAESVAELFGRTTEQILSMQNAYITASGRNVGMTAEDYGNMISVGRAFGMGDEETAQLLGNMNVFNMSVESGTDMMTRMYNTVTKMGLSASKFARDLSNNLRLAQKYNFKGGVENLAKMTQWAEQTRFNLNAATAMSDRIMGGDLSNLVETAAKLQVLGGSASIYADPIAMLYEAGADVGQLARRQAAMFNDITGTFNKLTGETDFTWFENMLIKQRAQAAGMSEEDAKNMIRQRHRQVEIDNVLRGSGLEAEDRTAIGNRATFNQKTQKWEVTDIRGQKHNIEEIKYNRELLENLLPENKDDAILSVAQKSLGFAEKQTIYQAWLVQHFGAMNYDEVRRASDRMLAAEKAYYARNEGNVNKNMGIISEAQAQATEHQYENMEANAAKITQTLKDYLAVMEKLSPLSQENIDQVAATTHELSKLEGAAAMLEYTMNKVTGSAAGKSLSMTGIYEYGSDGIFLKETLDYAKRNGGYAGHLFTNNKFGLKLGQMTRQLGSMNNGIFANVASQGVSENAAQIPGIIKQSVENIGPILKGAGDVFKSTVTKAGDYLAEKLRNILPGNGGEARAYGGIVGGRTAATKSEGMADNILVKASVGEYVVNAEATREHKALLDAINQGKISKTPAETSVEPVGGQGEIQVSVMSSETQKPTITHSGERNTIEPTGRVQSVPTPVESAYEPMDRLARSFRNALAEIEGNKGGAGTIDVSMNNSISVDGMSARDILAAIADAITKDPAGASKLQESLDQLGNMEYRMNYGKTV